MLCIVTLTQWSGDAPLTSKSHDCFSNKVDAAGSVVLVLVITLTGTCHS